jgi:hypothetical protein
VGCVLRVLGRGQGHFFHVMVNSKRGIRVAG